MGPLWYLTNNVSTLHIDNNNFIYATKNSNV